jgi:hypothetical protein
VDEVGGTYRKHVKDEMCATVLSASLKVISILVELDVDKNINGY